VDEPRIRWAGHEARMMYVCIYIYIYIYRISIENLQEKRPHMLIDERIILLSRSWCDYRRC
jgi:hypothetical protein